MQGFMGYGHANYMNIYLLPTHIHLQSLQEN